MGYGITDRHDIQTGNSFGKDLGLCNREFLLDGMLVT